METKLQMDVKVDEDEADVDIVVVDPDVHVGCDMPMSIYSQFFISFVSKLLRSSFFFQVSFQVSKRLSRLLIRTECPSTSSSLLTPSTSA